MTAFTWRSRLLSALCIFLLLALAACTGGGGEPVDDEPIPGTEPSIFGLSKSSVNAGEELTIFGSNFGTVQGNGTVMLGDTVLGVVSWSANEIEVTVPSGAESGIIVVTQNGFDSQSGQEAQLFVGTAPSPTPVILTISPEAARAGQDEISIVGTGFGAPGGSNAVLFTAEGGGTIAGTVVNNDATGNPQWTATNIRVLVPADARSGPVYVSTSNGPSNAIVFDVLPPQINLDNTKITDVSPGGGPVGTELVISGEDFGNFQGNSRVFLQSGGSDRDLLVQEWTNTSIRVTLPLGATTGTLHVIVSGKDVTWGTPIIVAELPEITAVSPSNLRIGKPLTIIGKHFGDTQGDLRIGNTTLAAAKITSWTNTQITVDVLPPVQLPDLGDPHLNVVVAAANGLESAPFEVQLVSDLIGTVSVSPKTGIATKTNFAFTVNAAGNEESVFRYTLIPDTANPSVTVVNEPISSTQSADPVLHYTYPAGNTSGYHTSVKIEDVTTGDFLILSDPNTPVIKVGAPGDVVIVDFGPLDFARGVIVDGVPSYPGENDQTIRIDPDTNDWDFSDLLFTPNRAVPEDIWLSRGDDDISVNGNSTQFTRNSLDFLFGTPKQRPYGYRRPTSGGGIGGKVRLHGYNFGATQGLIRLNAAGQNPITVPPANVIAWNTATDGSGNPAPADADGFIDFILPLDQFNIGGKVEVTNITTSAVGLSAEPLVVCAYSPFSIGASNASLTDPTITSTIIVYDAIAPQVPGVSGAQTRAFIIAQANYKDPFNNDTMTVAPKRVLVLNPIPVTITNGNTLSLDMTQFNGTANIEVYDATGANYQPVASNLGQDVVLYADAAGATYSVFLWTGVLPNDGTVSGQLLANCGVMSELKDFKVVP